MEDEDQVGSAAFAFTGSWRAYAPIAFTNLALTIVTLGFYRFWATARTRRYLWSNTQFIDETLEWTGTGKELFVGFLMVLLLLGGPFLFIQFGAQALVLQGRAGLAGLLSFASFVVIMYLVGVARFRALRYRLSRSWWRGIRGGSDDPGFGYGLSYLWKSFVGSLALGLMIPWSMMSLWNERWNKMSFGPHRFEAAGDHGKTFKRFLLFYLLPILLFAGIAVVAVMQRGGAAGPGGFFAFAAIMILSFYLGLGLIALAFYAKYFRVAVDGLSLAGLNFHFYARTKEWFKLFLGDIALVVCTLGIGMIFLQYRHWSFFIRHMGATGAVDPDELTQSRTRTARQGEGLLDAFDMGAI